MGSEMCIRDSCRAISPRTPRWWWRARVRRHFAARANCAVAFPPNGAQELLTQIQEKQRELRGAAAVVGAAADAAQPTDGAGAADADGGQPSAQARAGRKGKQQDAVLELYDQLLVEDNDALELLKADLKLSTGKEGRGGGAGASARAADPTHLLLLQRHFQLRKLRHTVRRHVLMLSHMRDRMATGSTPPAGAADRRAPTAEELSRVYTVVLQHLAEMSALLDAAEDAADIESVDLASLSAKAHRTYYIAASCMSAGKWRHARALLDRTAEHLADADTVVQTLSAQAVRCARAPRDRAAARVSPRTGAALTSGQRSKKMFFFHAGRAHQRAARAVRARHGGQAAMEDTIADRARLAALTAELAGARCRLRASEMLQTMEAQQPAGLSQDSMAALSLERGAGKYVLDNLDAFVCTALPPSGAHNELTLLPSPLGFETVPCKPLLFDVARNAVTLPDLSVHQKQERRGLFGRIWGR